MSGELLSLWHGSLDIEPVRPTWRQIASEVAEAHSISLDDLLGPSHKRKFSWPRQHAYAEVRRRTNLSWPAIGRRFDRDHTSCLKGAQRHQERIAAQ